MLILTVTALIGLAAIDGDTVIVNGAHIRVANIDAPETHHAKCEAERRLGLIATRRMDQLLKAGRLRITIGDPKTGRKTDRYGRTLATISVNGVDIGETLVTEGLARPWEGKRKPWCD